MPNLIRIEDLSVGYILNDEEKTYNYSRVENFDSYLTLPANTLLLKYGNDDCYLKLINESDDKLLSIMRLKKVKICDNDYYQVNKVKSIISGNGYGQFLYEYGFIHLNYPIISDRVQTKPGSSDLWKKFHELQKNAPYEISVLNENTKNERLYNRDNVWSDYEIWGWYPDFIPFIDEEDFLDKAFLEGDLNHQIFQYLKKGKTKVKDRIHIKLIGRKTQTPTQ